MEQLEKQTQKLKYQGNIQKQELLLKDKLISRHEEVREEMTRRWEKEKATLLGEKERLQTQVDRMERRL